jgi:hypothetical protein
VTSICLACADLGPEGAVVHVLEEDDGSGWVKAADPDGNQGLVPATYLNGASGGPFESIEPFEQKIQQASGVYGTSTAYCMVRSVFFSLLPNQQYGLSTTIELKDQKSLRSRRGTLWSCPLGHMEVKILQMVGGKVWNGLDFI